MTTRRDFLRRAAVATSASAVSLTMRPGLMPPPDLLALASANRALPPPPAGTPAAVAEDEAYWREVAAQYAVAALYIRTDALDRIDRAHGDDGPLDRIDSRIHTGPCDRWRGHPHAGRTRTRGCDHELPAPW
jgi:hypothetical protein